MQAPWAVLVIVSVVLHRLQVIVIFIRALTHGVQCSLDQENIPELSNSSSRAD